MKYLKYFENSAAVGNGVEVNLPNVSYLEDSNVLFVPGAEGTATVKYNSTTGEIEADTNPGYSTMYLTFKALESGTFSFSKVGIGNDIQYSLDGGSIWASLTSESNTPIVAAGNEIMWKAELTPDFFGGIGSFSSTGEFNAMGNIMSLLYGDNFVGQTDLTGNDYAFANLFYYNDKLIDAANLNLPATTLANYCYQSMFYGCTSLTTAPEISATTLANGCYVDMFNGCTSLTTAPALPAITLVDSCYYYMFCECATLTTAPELPATTLADYCYYNMFYGCTNLNYIKCLATDISASDCTYDWVDGVASTGTFVKDSSMSSWTTGSGGIPSGWTLVNA